MSLPGARMQYHQNGFSPGDPRIFPTGTVHSATLPECVDVLIVGSGPAGLVLAAQLAQFNDITTRLVERNEGPLKLGRADGIACRTVEMFHTLGFAEPLMREAYWVNETVFWRPDQADRTKIERTGRIQDVADDLSECPHLILNQARVHDYLLENLARSATRLEPDYGFEVADVENHGEGEHPLEVTLIETGGHKRTIRAKYVIGCDGARSTVRSSMGLDLKGDTANHAWGVMDILAVTDFPDIRLKSAIQSDKDGNILLIPREGGYLVRLYVDLGDVDPESRSTIRQTTSESAIATANLAMHPYHLDVKEIVWFSVYEVGQRLTDRFDDVPADEVGIRTPRIFIVGDACHTHSAKAGLGMNVSMQDAFNLGWKLAAVLQGRSDQQLLATYSAERQPVAQDLIDFDREWAAIMGAPPRDPNRPGAGGVGPTELQERFVKQGEYTAGVATCYPPSALIGESTYQELATGLVIGMRFHSAQVVRLVDAKLVELGHVHKADGRWRIYLFSDTGAIELSQLCQYLEHDPLSPVVRSRSEGAYINSVLDIRAVLQDHHRSIEITELPSLLRPRTGRLGLVDYSLVFTAPLSAGDNIYQRRGIDPDQGAMVVVRPDQYIANVLPLSAHSELSAFFSNLLIDG